MKVAVVGGNAAGATAAARLRRLRHDWDIVLFERSEYVSFSNCGFPYYLSGVAGDRAALFAEDATSLASRYRIDLRLRHEAIEVRPLSHELVLRDLEAGRTYIERYDKLLLAPGATPLRHSLPGIGGSDVVGLWSVADMDGIARRIEEGAKSAVILGAGRVGCLLAEALRARGLAVEIVEEKDQVLWPLDSEIASRARGEIESQGVGLRLGDSIRALEPRQAGGVDVRLVGGSTIRADFVAICAGLRPNARLAREAGLAIGETGGIAVGPGLRSSDPDIYAAGDVIEVTRAVTGLATLSSLAGPAQLQGRIAADNIAALHPGWEERYEGAVGSSIFRIWNLTAGMTGAWAEELERAGIPYRSVHVHAPSKARYMPGSATLHLKLFFGTEGRILGAHAAGAEGVDKRLDVIATAMQLGARVSDLERLQLCYSPSFGTARDPVNIAGSLALRALREATPR